MNIAFFEPLNRSWERMKHILWQPFDLAKWLVLGFSAWLAGLMDGAGGGGWKWMADDNDFPGRCNLHDTGEAFRNAGEALIWLPIIFVVIMAVAAILLLILWLSSRAKFIYLDNVIHNRAFPFAVLLLGCQFLALVLLPKTVVNSEKVALPVET